MINIRINGEKRQYQSGVEKWILEQINRRRYGGGIVCVEVNINFAFLNIVLRTPGCVTTPGASRPPTPDERKIFELWDSYGLNDPECTGVQVLGFLQYLRRNS